MSAQAVRHETGTPTRNGQRAVLPGVRSSRNCMRFDPSMTLDGWKLVGLKIGTHSDATCWWLGDWLAFGKTKYGRRYKEGVALTGLEYKTLRNYVVVARAFEWSRRRSDLSFQHHAEVCALPRDEQDLWLDLSARNGWSKSELRRQLRAPASDAVTSPSSALLRLALEPSRHERWRDAAERRQCSLSVWMMTVLDEAANVVLEQPGSTD